MRTSVVCFAILSSTRDPLTDAELHELLCRAYVDGGYTAAESAPVAFEPSAVRTRGEIRFVRNASDGRLAGMLILVLPSSPARRFAGPGEVELHLLAVHPGPAAAARSSIESGRQKRNAAPLSSTNS